MGRSVNPKSGAGDGVKFQAIVVGGGIVGLSAAWHLIRSGLRRVLVLERYILASGATGLGTGSVHTQRWHAIDSALILRSKRVMRELSERSGGAFRLYPVGRLTLAGERDEPIVRNYAAQLRSAGVDAVELSPREVAERFPGVNVSDVAVALHTGDDGIVYPPALLWTLAGFFRNDGGTIWEGCEVRRIAVEHRVARGIELANGDTIESDRVIVAAGIWTRQILRASGFDLVLKHSVAHTAVVTVGRADLWLQVPSLLDGTQGLIAIPRNPGTIMASNAAGEYEASKETAQAVLKARSVEVQRADAAFFEKKAVQQRHILRQLRHRYRDHDVRGVVGHWAGLLDGTPDSHPYVGPFPKVEAFWVGCCLTGYGVQRGPGVGEALAQLALERPLSVDMDAYRLDRFDPAFDFQIDMSGDNPFEGFREPREWPAMVTDRE